MQTAPLIAAGRARGGRATQQDALICLHDPDAGVRLMVLADGMGGDGAGELAAEGVIHIARRLWEQGLWREQPAAMFLETLCQQAHDELRRRREGLDRGEPHSTVVALLLKNDRASWVHVGDSRLYHFQGRKLLGRTEDHSLAQLKVRRGELTEDQLASDADQHKLLRGLGGPQSPEVEHGFAILHPGQNFALCSDGVWEQLSASELAHWSRLGDQRAAVHEALIRAVERGGDRGDNVALIFARCTRSGWMRRCGEKLRTVVGGGDSGHRNAAARYGAPAQGVVRSRRENACAGIARTLGLLTMLSVLGLAGCAQMKTLKNKAGEILGGGPHAVVATTEPTPTTTPEPERIDSLSAIINNQLQRGHYSVGRKDLQQYLKQHPGDPAAKFMLRQLTADPEQLLGTKSRSYVVQKGDSYSTLAERYLGNSSRFLILARYNGSSDPSVLNVGQTIRLPLEGEAASAASASKSDHATDAMTESGKETGSDASTATVDMISPVDALHTRAQQLQQQSLAMLAQGHKQQALDTYGKALDLDPGLQPADAQASTLRKQLLTSYHQHAIVLYRDQKLDQAIALWNRVLAIDPNYESAVIYRARALELKHRLKQL